MKRSSSSNRARSILPVLGLVMGLNMLKKLPGDLVEKACASIAVINLVGQW
jgi:hypothetical protein